MYAPFSEVPHTQGLTRVRHTETQPPGLNWVTSEEHLSFGAAHSELHPSSPAPLASPAGPAPLHVLFLRALPGTNLNTNLHLNLFPGKTIPDRWLVNFLF